MDRISLCSWEKDDSTEPGGGLECYDYGTGPDDDPSSESDFPDQVKKDIHQLYSADRVLRLKSVKPTAIEIELIIGMCLGHALVVPGGLSWLTTGGMWEIDHSMGGFQIQTHSFVYCFVKCGWGLLCVIATH